MAISLTFSFVVYNLATNELANGLNQQTQQWYSRFPAFDDDPFFSHHPTLNTGTHAIFMRLLYFNLVVLVGAGLASYALARMTLYPIEEAHARQKRFTADVSHELRTPLTALRMESEVALMDRSSSKESLRDTLKSNVEESQKLESLINNLLRISRLDAGQVDKQFEKLTADQIVGEAIEHVVNSAVAKQITFENHVGKQSVFGDKTSLIQVLVILLDNSIKYSHEKQQVFLDSRKDGSTTVLSVRDEGVGIDQSALKHVFDRFYRSDKARTGSQGVNGYGLGLSIAKNLAELNHATIDLSSRLGKGTTAFIRVPSHPIKSGYLTTDPKH